MGELTVDHGRSWVPLTLRSYIAYIETHIDRERIPPDYPSSIFAVHITADNDRLELR